MTMRSEFILECICGHKGKIKMSENDQPYSKMWERYTLENFNGNSYYCEGITLQEENLIERLNPVCPKCGYKLTKDNYTMK